MQPCCIRVNRWKYLLITNDFAIDVKGLNKFFGDKHVVKDLSLQVRRGEILGFLGPNGSGKTTAIRMLCGLLTPDSGEGHCLGYDIFTQSDAIKRDVGYMTQRFSYWEDLSIRENLDFVARVYELANRKEIVNEALKTLGLTSRASQLGKITLRRLESSGLLSQRVCSAIPNYSSWMNPLPELTPVPEEIFGKSFMILLPKGYPYSSAPIIWMKRSDAINSPTSRMVIC